MAALAKIARASSRTLHRNRLARLEQQVEDWDSEEDPEASREGAESAYWRNFGSRLDAGFALLDAMEDDLPVVLPPSERF